MDERTTVLREGERLRVNPSELVVGDLIVLQAGDSIPADCVLVSSICTTTEDCADAPPTAAMIAIEAGAEAGLGTGVPNDVTTTSSPSHITTSHPDKPNDIRKSKLLINESSLTGESEDVKKSPDRDPFLLSSCLVTEGEETIALVLGTGKHSQWGRIKETLVTEPAATPLQEKLEGLTHVIGYIGAAFAFLTFVVHVAGIFYMQEKGMLEMNDLIRSFILSVTILVVAIPEGLPLAVTISLAYSTKKMYKDQCFIRVLAACETMGNCTSLCSDKTGTLTENRMTVVCGWFAGTILSDQARVNTTCPCIQEEVKTLIVEQCCVNRTAYITKVHIPSSSLSLSIEPPSSQAQDLGVVVGNKTEGALIHMVHAWGFQYEQVHANTFKEGIDCIYSFNSLKKRSTAIIHQTDGSVRLYVKGATEWMLADCTHYTDREGNRQPLESPGKKMSEITSYIDDMTSRALRTLLLAHKDYSSPQDMPANWRECPPDSSDLTLDCIVGIEDPLRDDVIEAVKLAQTAGITVRMITGDNPATAATIASQCGILTHDGIVLSGADMRNMTPMQLDRVLPKLQVVARSSPADKHLLVSRLNGNGIPKNEEEWMKMHSCVQGVAWDSHKDLLLPGYRYVYM